MQNHIAICAKSFTLQYDEIDIKRYIASTPLHAFPRFIILLANMRQNNHKSQTCAVYVLQNSIVPLVHEDRRHISSIQNNVVVNFIHEPTQSRYTSLKAMLLFKKRSAVSYFTIEYSSSFIETSFPHSNFKLNIFKTRKKPHNPTKDCK